MCKVAQSEIKAKAVEKLLPLLRSGSILIFFFNGHCFLFEKKKKVEIHNRDVGSPIFETSQTKLGC